LSLAPAADAGERRITIAGATIGGSLYIITTGMAKVISQYVPGVTATAQTGDVNANIGSVQKGDVEIGGTQPQGMRWSWDGAKYMKHFGQTRNVRLFLPSANWAVHFLVLPDSPVKQIADIKGKTISMGGALSSSEVIEELLKLYGLELDRDYKGKRMGHQAAVDALKDRTLDVAVPFGAVPAPAAMDAMTTKKARLIPVEVEKLRELGKDSPYWFPLTIKKGALPNMENDVVTLGGFDIFVIHKDLPEDLVYQMAKALIEHADEVEKVHPGGSCFRFEYVKEMIENKRFVAGGTPYHPGVLRYLAERGLRP
jgi:TRAP transporter TAXI family solute receptor